MSKVFIIPDVHLKPWMFEKASTLVTCGDCSMMDTLRCWQNF